MNDTLTLLQLLHDRHLHDEHPGYAFLCNVQHVHGTKQQVEKTWRDVAYPVKHLDKLASAALNLSKGGKDVYISVRQFNGEQRAKNDCLNVPVLYADGDGCGIPDGFPEPSIIVETSPRHFHYFWLLTRPISPEQADDLGERTTRRIGADPSGYDATQVLRLPGTRNYTQPGCPVVRLITAQPDLLHDPTVFEALPPNPKKPEPIAAIDVADEPPVALSTYGKAVWDGQRPKQKKNGDPDRSETFWKLGCLLVEAGLSVAWVRPALLDRDAAWGWGRFTEHPEDLARIIGKLAAKFADAPPKPSPDPGIAAAREHIERDLDTFICTNPAHQHLEAEHARLQDTIEVQKSALKVARANYGATLRALQQGGAIGKTIIGIAIEAERAYKQGAEPGEPFMPYRADIGKWTSTSAACVSTHVGRLEDREALVRIPTYVKPTKLDRETGVITYPPDNQVNRRTVIALGTTERSYAGIVDYLLSVPEQPEEPKQGGLRVKSTKRLCPTCGNYDDPVLHAHCRGCAHDFGPVEQAESLSEQNASIESDSPPCGSPSSVGAICVDRPDWRAEALADVPVSSEGAVRILTRATPVPAESHAGTCSECGVHMWLLPADAGRCRTCVSASAYADVARAGG